MIRIVLMVKIKNKFNKRLVNHGTGATLVRIGRVENNPLADRVYKVRAW